MPVQALAEWLGRSVSGSGQSKQRATDGQTTHGALEKQAEDGGACTVLCVLAVRGFVLPWPKKEKIKPGPPFLDLSFGHF